MSRAIAAIARPGPLVRLLVAAALAAGSLLGGAAPAGLQPPQVLAATPDLTVVSSARYDVEPDRGRIAVTVDLTATNHLVDTPTTRYYYERAFLAVQPGATGFAASGGIGRPSVSISETEPTYVLLRIEFGARLGSGASTAIRLTFEIPDAGEPPDRDVRVSPTLVTFPVWAFASTATPGSSVTLVVPAGYAVSFPRGKIAGPTTDEAGRQVWSSGPIADPLAFDLYVRADRPPTFVESRRTVTVGERTASFTFRGWADDPGWLTRTGELFLDGVPRLAAAIGRPWPLETTLVVEEVLNPATSGIAGSFDPARSRIEVIYRAGPEVVLHEAAHAWFNGGFLADRWANEAFASYYAEVAATELGLPFEPAVVTDELRPARLPLNAWALGDVPPPEGADRSAVEAYGYAAAAELARQIAERAGADGMRDLWAAIDGGIAPYQPPGGPAEYLVDPPDWRVLLDLLENDGTAQYGDLWAQYVIRQEDAIPLLDRTDARRAYGEALALAGDWRLPRVIRDALREWRFDATREQLDLALAVLEARETLAAEAAAAGLTLPSTLRESFEGAGDLAGAKAEADAERQVIAAIGSAAAARPDKVGLVEWIGLLGASPERRIDEAGAAFGAGDLPQAMAAAEAAEASWLSAEEAGGTRLTALGVGSFVVLLVALGLRLRRSRGVPA